MPKNRSRLRNSQTDAGRSRRWKTSQSSVIPHTVSTGPSRKACSSALSPG